MTAFRNNSAKEKASKLFFLICFVIYAIVSMTKSAYAAAIASIIGEGLFTKSSAGIINAGFYLFYATGQLVGVKFVDKISPVKLVSITLIGTLISTIGMAMSTNFWMLLGFWSFCGLVQFPIWPAIVRILSEYLLIIHRDKANTIISFAFCFGTFINYFMASIVLGLARWTMLFWVTSLIIVLCLLAWVFVLQKTKPEISLIVEENKIYNEQLNQRKHSHESASAHSFLKLLFASGLLFLLLPALFRTALDAGVKSWVPTMIVENYSVSAEFASTLTTILVFVNATGVFLVRFIYPRKIKNSVWGYALCFLTALPVSLLLLLIGKVHVALIVFALTVLTTLMYSGHQFINIIIPSHFIPYHRTGSVAALLNALASFGAVLANIAFGFLSEHYGWTITTASWRVIILLSFVFCAIATPFWEAFVNQKNISSERR